MLRNPKHGCRVCGTHPLRPVRRGGLALPRAQGGTVREPGGGGNLLPLHQLPVGREHQAVRRETREQVGIGGRASMRRCPEIA